MAADAIDQVVEKIVLAKKFALLLDESTDISNEAELVTFVRVPNKVEIVEHILFCNSLKGNATGRVVYEVLNYFLNKQKSSGSGVKLYVQMAEQPQQVHFQACFHWWKKKTIQLLLITVSSTGKPWRKRN
jgi:hypothetical protein